MEAVTAIRAGEAEGLDYNNGGRDGKTSRKILTYMKRQHTMKRFNEMEKHLPAECQLLVTNDLSTENQHNPRNSHRAPGSIPRLEDFLVVQLPCLCLFGTLVAHVNRGNLLPLIIKGCCSVRNLGNDHTNRSHIVQQKPLTSSFRILYHERPSQPARIPYVAPCLWFRCSALHCSIGTQSAIKLGNEPGPESNLK